MRRLLPRRASAAAVISAIALAGAAAVLQASTAQASTAQASTAGASAGAAASAVRADLTVAWRPAPDGFAQSGPTVTTAKSARQRTRKLPRVVVPDLFAAASHSITATELSRLARLRYVRGVLAVDGGAVSVGGRTVATIGVNAADYRSWTPPQTAAQQSVWTALGRGELVTTPQAGKKLGLLAGKSYQVSGASNQVLQFGRTASLGIPGVDAVVASKTSRALGLVPQIGVLISAPKATLATLEAQIRGVIGRQSRLVSLRPARTVPVQQAQLPLHTQQVPGRPSNYLQLFQASAAQYCPQLSWTVLAAIGQIESGDGQNMGPSSAGALGPMQFLPSTWARWGVVAFGQPGPPDIWSAFDAVPAAADYLCASGASQGPSGYAAAVFSYNHATWYVAEVLALAHEYAQQYG